MSKILKIEASLIVQVEDEVSADDVKAVMVDVLDNSDYSHYVRYHQGAVLAFPEDVEQIMKDVFAATDAGDTEALIAAAERGIEQIESKIGQQPEPQLSFF
jgi:transcriptional regulator NrdR family protein